MDSHYLSGEMLICANGCLDNGLVYYILGERVERSTWVRSFLKEVDYAQIQFDRLQCLADKAKRDLEPFNRWLQVRHNEWEEKRLEDPEEAERMITHEAQSAEYQDQMKKLEKVGKEAHEASSKRYRAEEEVEFAGEGLKAAQLDDIGETIERATLIKVAQEEVQSAQIRFQEARESTAKIELKGKVVSVLRRILDTKGKMKRHNVLLEWIEQQRREIAASCAPTQKEVREGRSRRASSRALQNYPVAKASRPNKPRKAIGRERKQSMARSFPSPVDPAKVSGAPRKRRSAHQKISVPHSASQAAETPNTDSSTPESRGKQALKVKDTMPASLRPIHSSKVSKPGGKQLARLRKDGTKLPPTTGTYRLTREKNLSSLSTRRKAMQQSANTSLRRSTRISKQPERFRLSYA